MFCDFCQISHDVTCKISVSSSKFNMLSSLLHPQPSVLIVSYIESAKAAAQFGVYQKAEWKPDDSMIAVAVSAAPAPYHRRPLATRPTTCSLPTKHTNNLYTYSNNCTPGVFTKSVTLSRRSEKFGLPGRKISSRKH